MKKNIVGLFIISSSLFAKTSFETQCLFPIGKKAQNFTAQAVTGQKVHSLELEQLPGDFKVIFFYPRDFTFVCPTEVCAFNDRITEFQKRKVDIVGISVDPIKTHLRWLNTPREKGGVKGISYPLVSDESADIAKSYGVYNEENKTALRGLFILNKENLIQSVCINSDPLGRNVDEVLRIIDALISVQKFGAVCPANWHKGQPTMKPTHEGLEKYLKQTSKKD